MELPLPTGTGNFGPHSPRVMLHTGGMCTPGEGEERHGMSKPPQVHSGQEQMPGRGILEGEQYIFLACLKLTLHLLVLAWVRPALAPLPSPGVGKRSVLLSPPCPGSGAVSLCGPGAVEACLLHQLRRRAAGFLRSDKMAALFTKVGKTCPMAGEICHKVQELQQQVEGR